MPFTIPDNDLAFNTNQSIWMATDIAIMLASLNGDSVVSGCAVTAQGSPNMTLAVAAGFILSQNTQLTFPGGTATVTTANSSNPRTDLITISPANVLTVTAGTPAILPRPPDLPSGHIALAMIYVPANDTAIQSNQITDKRVITGGGLSGGGFTQSDLGYTTAGSNWSTPTTGNTVVYLKKVTIPSDGVIGTVGGYVKGDGSHVGVIGSQIWSDNSGTPNKIIQFTPSAATTGNFYIGSGGQWIDFPCGLKVTAGQVVWLAIYIYNNAGSSSLGYDSANNHDRATTNIGGYWPSDLFSTADNNVTWSIRASLIRSGSSTGGLSLLGITKYAPATIQIYSTTSTTYADVDATNLAVSFTAPASGNVIVKASVWVDGSASTLHGALGLREGSTDLGTPVMVTRDADNGYLAEATWYLVGISSGLHTYKLSYARYTTGTFRVLASASVDGTNWAPPAILAVYNAGIAGIPSPTGAAMLLDTSYTGSDISAASMTGGADYEVIANQTFVVNSASSLVEIAVRTFCQSHKSAAGDSGLIGKIIIDSAGTPITKSIGGLVASNTEYRSVLSGSGSVFISGLVAGSHTVKVVLRPDATCDLYLRPSSSTEFMTLQVVEHVSTGLVVAGTAFPTSPFTGQQFFRTDLGYDCYYDGARWLTKTEFMVPVALQDQLAPATTSPSVAGYAVLDNGTYDAYITTIVCTTTVVTTNNGSNYWTVQFRRGPSSTSIGSSFNTSADTAGTNTRHNVTVNALAGTSDKFVDISITKTSAPGGIYVLAAVKYRLVVT